MHLLPSGGVDMLEYVRDFLAVEGKNKCGIRRSKVIASDVYSSGVFSSHFSLISNEKL